MISQTKLKCGILKPHSVESILRNEALVCRVVIKKISYRENGIDKERVALITIDGNKPNIMRFYDSMRSIVHQIQKAIQIQDKQKIRIYQ